MIRGLHEASPVAELPPEQLRITINPASVALTVAESGQPQPAIIGQERAIAALQFGLGVHNHGFNVYAAGPPGIGKTTAVQAFLSARAQSQPTPDDWCYVNNFDDPSRPQALRLPAGRGRQLQGDVRRVIGQVRREIPHAFESDAYTAQTDAVGKQVRQQRDALLEQMSARAAAEQFLINLTPMGLILIPARNGEPMSEEAFESLPPDTRNELLLRRDQLQEELRTTAMQQGRILERAAQEKLRTLEQQLMLSVVGGLFDDLNRRYHDLPEVGAYFSAMQQDIIEHSDLFKAPKPEATTAEGALAASFLIQELPFRKCQVNLLVDNSKQAGAPVIVERNPSYVNLFGRVEKEAMFGALTTDFTLVKAGALQRANGGYLVLPADDLLRNPLSWDALKRAIRSKQVEIEEPGEQLGLMTTKTVRPQPMPLDVKIVLIGSPTLYALLSAYDDSFTELFRIKADFDTTMPRTPDSTRTLAGFITRFGQEEGLLPVDASAVAQLLEFAIRHAEDQQKLSLHFGTLADVIREASFWAAQAGATTTGAAHVVRALDEKIYRASLVASHLQESITDGTLLIATDGAAVGEVNGLSVFQSGDIAFGRPSRITASVGPGRGEVMDIEREVELGGPIHSKGVLILSGYLTQTYACQQPLTLAARLVFEQSYGGIEGDSASSAELYALLSALAGLPINQGMAVTGSVNQHGAVQAIGGVNEKIEGFFDVCRGRGLTGQQGVLIPRSNVQHLMLRPDVVEAVRAGRFHIWPVATIDEGITLLTGVPAGLRQFDGSYPVGSVNERIARRLGAFAASVHQQEAHNGVLVGEEPLVPHVWHRHM
ncbi:MAG: AAA family ATPase [Chloroflexaceae bacterium]|jgi:lon-related putative ATP-dependent protease|nr:AAA family ATPase [Chloroflexaceae bacterium]